MIGVIVLAAALLMLIVEIALPGRAWPTVKNWWPRAILLNIVQAASVYLISPFWDKLFEGKALWNGSDHLGTWGGALFGYVVVTFIYYWWHRLRHSNTFLWKYFHQVHHSPQRLEIVTSFYKHPVEIIANSFLSSFILVVLCGLSREATTIAVLVTGIAELFYHWNVKTPYWLGFIFQRPESHCVHHEMGSHSKNYSDLPIWDMMFGTFHNPKEFSGKCGFEEDRELQLPRMLRGIDVNATLGVERE